MQSVLKILFLIGNRGKISQEKKPFWGEIYFVLSQERNVVETSNLVKLAFRSVKIFQEKKLSKKISKVLF